MCRMMGVKTFLIKSSVSTKVFSIKELLIFFADEISLGTHYSAKIPNDWS